MKCNHCGRNVAHRYDRSSGKDQWMTDDDGYWCQTAPNVWRLHDPVPQGGNVKNIRDIVWEGDDYIPAGGWLSPSDPPPAEVIAAIKEVSDDFTGWMTIEGDGVIEIPQGTYDLPGEISKNDLSTASGQHEHYIASGEVDDESQMDRPVGPYMTKSDIERHKAAIKKIATDVADQYIQKEEQLNAIRDHIANAYSAMTLSGKKFDEYYVKTYLVKQAIRDING